MAEDIKGLIEKIQQEGIQVAQDKASEIENEAKKHAQGIVENAKRRAEEIIAQAKDNIAQMEKSSQVSLQQAGRDLLLALRAEIREMLDKLILTSVHQALTPEELSKIIAAIIKGCPDKSTEEIVISLKKEDAEKLENGFLSKLQEETKRGITLKPSEDILGGFIISYDAGKSHFDFTDKALVEYISLFLKPKLSEILKDIS